MKRLIGTCETCLYWYHGDCDVLGMGDCRRYPPIAIDLKTMVAYWPNMDSKDFCGEYVEMPTKAARIHAKRSL